MFLQIFFAALLLIVLQIWLNSRTRRNLPPGPNPILPILGNIPQLMKYQAEATYETYDKLIADYGPVVFIQFGKISQVIIQDLVLVKEVLCSDIWIDRCFDDMIAERSYGKNLGIIFASGEVWNEMRRFTMKTLRDFGFGRKDSMESVLDEEITEITSRLDKIADKGDPLSMKYFFSVSVVNVLWSMIAGQRFSHEDTKLQELIILLHETFNANPVKASVIIAIPGLWNLFKNTPKSQQRRKFIKKLQQFFLDILTTRRQSGTYNEDPKDFVDVFLQKIDLHKEKNQSHNMYTDEQFVVVCFDLFVAGLESTSNTLEFAMLYMILNPRVQQKVQVEIDHVVGKSRRPSLLDRAKMPYTEATILEIQRMTNVLPIALRGAIQDTTVAGYHIPKGTLAGLNLYSLHLNKDIWGDPMNFRPERFLDPKNQIINANKILPFGSGKRVCPGEAHAKASLFIYFTSLLQRYSFTPTPDEPNPSVKPVLGFSSSPQEYQLNLKQR